MAVRERRFAQVFLAGPTDRIVSITVANTWTAQPSGASFYGGSVSAAFSFSTTSGVLTYTGPTRTFLLTAALTFVLAGAVAEFVEVVTAINSELVGTTTDTVFGQGVTEPPALSHSIVAKRLVTLANGDTIRSLVRNAGSTEDITYSMFTLTVEGLSS